MKYIYILLLLFLSSSLSAQKIRFSDTTNVWKVEWMSWPDNPNWITDHESFYYGETIYNNLYYREAWFLHSNYVRYVREDTSTGIVYYLQIDVFDTTELVLYNFNMVIGDTIRTSIDTGFVHVVTAIDSTLINNTWHKVWQLIPVGSEGGEPYNVIEGIGSMHGAGFPAHPRLFEQNIVLRCFTTQGNSPLINPPIGSYGFDNNISCSVSLNTSEINKLFQKVTVAPNPITAESQITFNKPITSAQLSIYNSIGQLIVSQGLQNVTNYPIGDKTRDAGLYYYRITDNQTGKTYSGKLVAN